MWGLGARQLVASSIHVVIVTLNTDVVTGEWI
jgi:hypothetical protein